MNVLRKWLDDNPLGIALGILCGIFLCILLALIVLSALPLPESRAIDEEELAGEALQIPVLPENLPIDSYAVIIQRPLFNETRLPVSRDDEAGEDLVIEEEEIVGAPEVELSGVVITPTLRMVTLKRKDDSKSLVAFEGRPIEADFGSWQVSSIEARAAVLTSGRGEELRLEMKVHDAKIEQPERPVEPVTEEPEAELQAAVDQASEQGEPVSRAEEIRQRIAERREELKREAEQSEQGGDQAEAQSYQQAIQSLMGGNRGTKTNNDEQQ